MRLLRSAAAGLLAITLSTGLMTLTAPAGNAQVSQPLTKFDVTSITPNMVTGDAPNDLTVTGTVTNTSDHPLHNLEAIFQRGAAMDGEATAQAAVRGDAAEVTAPIFKPLAADLEPGQQTPVTMQVPLRGGTGSLQVSQLGDYPIMININAEPNNGRSRRVYEMRFVLPVTSLPGMAPTPPAEATPTTLLVPIVDYPRVEQAPVDGPVILTDDQLATSLAPGGRLDGLVEAATDGAENPSLGNALCFAIDPDLLDTVNAMQSGYQVRQSNGSLRGGTGATAARQWLNKLKTAVRGRCVLALPYADADVVALGRAGLPDVIKNSRDGSMVVQQMLDVTPRTDLFWPIDGLLDEPAASDLTAQGVRTMLLRPDDLATPPGKLQPVRVKEAGADPEPTALPIDPLLASALDPQNTAAPSPADNGILSVQNTLGALEYRADTGFHRGETAVLAPPRRWNLRAEDLRTLFEGIQQLTTEGYLKPTALPSPQGTGGSSSPTPSTENAPPETTLTYPASAKPNEIPQPLLRELAEQNFEVGALYQSTVMDTAAHVQPAALTTPLSNALLRATSGAWRGNQGAPRDWLNSAEASLNSVLSGIGLEQWDGTITLTSSNASIPVWVTNPLPVTVDVSLLVRQQVGLDVKTLGDAGNPLKIPPRSHRPFYLQTTALRAGQFSVDVTVVTATGDVKLGQTKRLQLENFAYGSLTIPLTVIAFALLVVLSARRITRRIRGGRNKHSAASADSTDIAPPTTTITVETVPIARTRPHRVPGDSGSPDSAQ